MLDWLRPLSLPPRWVRWLPGTSTWFGPPRRWASVQNYASQHGLATWSVEPPEIVPAPRPVTFGDVDSAYRVKQAQVIPAKVVFRLGHGRIYGADGNIVTDDDTFLWDTAWHESYHPPEVSLSGRALFRHKRARPRRRLPGCTAAITSDWAIGSFAHFLTDALPRWRLLLAAGFRATDFDHVALYHPNSPTARFLIEAAGVPVERIVPYDPSANYECDELVATTFPGIVPAISPASIAWLRGLPRPGSDKRRVYISRAGYRRHPANAAELESEFSRRGYAVVHGDDGTQAMAACGAAQAIIGVEGSNLFNLCFAPVGTRVVLLLPGPDTIPYISFICQAAGLEIAIVPAKAGTPPTAPIFPLAAVTAALDWAEPSTSR